MKNCREKFSQNHAKKSGKRDHVKPGILARFPEFIRILPGSCREFQDVKRWICQ